MYQAILASILSVAFTVNALPANVDSGALIFERDMCTGYFAFGPLMNNEHCKGIVDSTNAMQAITGVCQLYGICNAGSGAYPSGSYKYGNVTASLKWGPECSHYGDAPTDTTVESCINTYFNFYFAGGSSTGNGICPENTGQQGHYVGGNIHWCDGSTFKLS